MKARKRMGKASVTDENQYLYDKFYRLWTKALQRPRKYNLWDSAPSDNLMLPLCGIIHHMQAWKLVELL